MFDDLRAAFRQAVENFNRELHRDRVPETLNDLLRGMKRELVEAKVALRELEAQIERTLQQSRHEAEQAEICARRETMARRIDDEETAELAADYRKRHLERHTLLDRKITTLREELELRTRDAAEMTDRIREATAEREGLAASTGRSSARRSLSESDELFAELDRMAERVGDEEARAAAAEALNDLNIEDRGRRSELHVDLDSAPPEPPDVDAALAELKRRMGSD